MAEKNDPVGSSFAPADTAGGNLLRLVVLGMLYGVSILISVAFSPAINLQHAPADQSGGVAADSLARR